MGASAGFVELQPPLQPMVARSVEQLPNDNGAGRFSFEPKMDGFRCLAFRTAGDRVMLQSRQQRWLTRYFPEVVAALLERVPAGTVLDGELVVVSGGRLSFAALQRRIHPSSAHHAARVVEEGRPWSGVLAPAVLVVFDVLALAGQDLRGEPYRRRRKRLRRLLDGSTEPLLLMPATRDLVGAHAWMDQHAEAGIEGVVVKDRNRGYRPGRPRTSWLKVRVHHTVEAVVGGVVGPLDAPDALLLGRVDEKGRLRVVGRTTPLTLPARRELGAVLAAPRSVHPWPAVLPANRFGHWSADDVAYTPTEPNVVVELDADTAYEHGRWRHPTRFRRVRLDLQPGEISRQ